jgi:hypothetical protein
MTFMEIWIEAVIYIVVIINRLHIVYPVGFRLELWHNFTELVYVDIF